MKIEIKHGITTRMILHQVNIPTLESQNLSHQFALSNSKNSLSGPSEIHNGRNSNCNQVDNAISENAMKISIMSN